MSLAYLTALLLSLGGLGVLDYRYRLVLFDDLARGIRALAIGMVIFVGWDLAGISSGIFLAGHSRYATGIFLLPQFPLEELFFLLLLVYLPLVVWRGGAVWRRTM